MGKLGVRPIVSFFFLGSISFFFTLKCESKPATATTKPLERMGPKPEQHLGHEQQHHVGTQQFKSTNAKLGLAQHESTTAAAAAAAAAAPTAAATARARCLGHE